VVDNTREDKTREFFEEIKKDCIRVRIESGRNNTFIQKNGKNNADGIYR
jgi:hypothetical protein